VEDLKISRRPGGGGGRHGKEAKHEGEAHGGNGGERREWRRVEEILFDFGLAVLDLRRFLRPRQHCVRSIVDQTPKKT
jgi:hypothetical protein